MAQRVKNHEMRNQARKLTPEMRKEKKRRKMLNDSGGARARPRAHAPTAEEATNPSSL